MARTENYGTQVIRHINYWCPECADSVSLSPGPLNGEETVEYRTCEESHIVEVSPIFYCPPGEATEMLGD